MTVLLKTTLESFKDALTQGTALAAWATAAYGHAHKVFVNIDIRNPPDAADCPYIMLRPVVARYGRGATQKMMEFEMMCCLYDEAAQTNAETNVVEYAGGQKTLDFLDLAVAAIGAVSTGNALLQDVTADFETIEFFPFFMAGCPLVLVEPLTLGADRLAL